MTQSGPYSIDLLNSLSAVEDLRLMTEGTIPSILAKQDWPRIIAAALGHPGSQEPQLCGQLKAELRSNGIECGSPTIPFRRLLVDIGPEYPSEKEWPFVIEVKFFRTRKNHSMRTKEAGSLIFDFVKVALCPARERYVLLITDQEMKNYLQNNIPELLSGQRLPIPFPDVHIAASHEAIVDKSRFSIIVYSVATARFHPFRILCELIRSRLVRHVVSTCHLRKR